MLRTILSVMFLSFSVNVFALEKIYIAEGHQPGAALLYIAEEQGYFKENGIDVQFDVYPSGRHCLDAILGQKVQFGTVAETPLVHAAFNKQDYKILMTMESSTNNLKVLARKSSGITKPEDIAGKKISTLLGTNGEYMMDMFLRKYNIAKRDVTIISLSPPDMVNAIARGDVDAIFVWEPNVFFAKERLKENAIEFNVSDIYFETFNLVALSSYVEKNQKIVKGILNALDKAGKFANNNKDKTMGIVARKIDMKKELLANIWSYYNFAPTNVDLVGLMEKQGAWVLESQMPVFSNYIYK